MEATIKMGKSLNIPLPGYIEIAILARGEYQTTFTLEIEAGFSAIHDHFLSKLGGRKYVSAA